MRLPDPLLESRSPGPFPTAATVSPKSCRRSCPGLEGLGPASQQDLQARRGQWDPREGMREECLCCRDTRGAHPNGNEGEEPPAVQPPLWLHKLAPGTVQQQSGLSQQPWAHLGLPEARLWPRCLLQLPAVRQAWMPQPRHTQGIALAKAGTEHTRVCTESQGSQHITQKIHQPPSFRDAPYSCHTTAGTDTVQLLCQTWCSAVFTEVRSHTFPKKRVAHPAVHMTGEGKVEHFLLRASPSPILHNSHLWT